MGVEEMGEGATKVPTVACTSCGNVRTVPGAVVDFALCPACSQRAYGGRNAHKPVHFKIVPQGKNKEKNDHGKGKKRSRVQRRRSSRGSSGKYRPPTKSKRRREKQKAKLEAKLRTKKDNKIGMVTQACGCGFQTKSPQAWANHRQANHLVPLGKKPDGTIKYTRHRAHPHGPHKRGQRRRRVRQQRRRRRG